MRHILLASVAAATLIAAPLHAQEAPEQAPNAPAADGATGVDSQNTQSTNPNADLGALGGGAAGAGIGAVVGGPVGAVIGGFAGAMIGTASAAPKPVVDYVVANPVEPVVIEGGISEGAVLPDTVTVTPIPDQPDYAYVYSDGRPVIVEAQSRKVIHSPGYVVPEQTVAYVQENRSDPVMIDGGLAVGTVVPGDVQLIEIPSDPAYAYVYTDAGPVLVNKSSRTVVWIEG